MKSGLSVFFVALFALGASWMGFVVGPVIQLGRQEQTSVLTSSDPYPIQRPGPATMGLQVYRANGCAACHTEQIQQEGVACTVVLTSAGKNPAAVSNLVATLKLDGLDEGQASAVAGRISAAGGKSETHIIATGGDIPRGWGLRHSVAADYLYDYPVQLGTLRVGPDLAAIGVRQPDANWHFVHLYDPQCKTPGSAMPSFKFLFDVRKIDGSPSPDALDLPKEFAPADGYEVVPKPEAKELVAYLLSLRADAPLYEAPFTPQSTATSADAKK